MPANLPPQYYAAQKRLRHTRDVEEQLEILTEMQAIMPKHKGTDKLQAELRSKIATLRKEAQKSGTKRKRHDGYNIDRQGAGQVALIGFPNVGKSTIVASLTNADVQIATYPFTTTRPVVGMMPFKDISIQLIDTPPISADFVDRFLPELLRRADLMLFVVDVGSDNVLDQVETVLDKLAESRIKLTADDIQHDDEYLYKKAFIVANKRDVEGSRERFDILKEFYSEKFTIVTISATEKTGIEQLKRQIYSALGIIRVYTKAMGKKVDLVDPIILKHGSTVIDAAAEIHKEFFADLKFARIWGEGQNKYNGQRVSRDHPLEDENILEFHISGQ